MYIELEKHPKEFYDEVLYIEVYYKNKLKDKPRQKVRELTKFMKNILLFIGIILILELASIISLAIEEKYVQMGTQIAFFTVFLIFGLITIKQLLFAKKTLKANIFEDASNDLKSKIWIDNKLISLVLEKNKELKAYELKWKDIKMILINKYSIAIIPEDEEKSKIFISSEYKETLLEEIKKHEKGKYVIDNSSRYRKTK